MFISQYVHPSNKKAEKIFLFRKFKSAMPNTIKMKYVDK